MRRLTFRGFRKYCFLGELHPAARGEVPEGFLKRPGGFPGGVVVENLPANAGDTGSSPGLGRSHVLRSN